MANFKSVASFAWELVKGFGSVLLEEDTSLDPNGFPKQMPDVVRSGSFDVNLKTATELFRDITDPQSAIRLLYVRTRQGNYIKVKFVYGRFEDAWRISEWDAKAAYVNAKDAKTLVSDSWHPSTEI